MLSHVILSDDRNVKDQKILQQFKLIENSSASNNSILGTLESFFKNYNNNQPKLSRNKRFIKLYDYPYFYWIWFLTYISQ